MKKMLKIMAMLLVIATVMFAAGCAEKAETTNETTSEEAPVSEENVTVGEEAGAVAPEAAVEDVNATAVVEDDATAVVEDVNATEAAADNTTEEAEE